MDEIGKQGLLPAGCHAQAQLERAFLEAVPCPEGTLKPV